MAAGADILDRHVTQPLEDFLIGFGTVDAAIFGLRGSACGRTFPHSPIRRPVFAATIKPELTAPEYWPTAQPQVFPPPSDIDADTQGTLAVAG